MQRDRKVLRSWQVNRANKSCVRKERAFVCSRGLSGTIPKKYGLACPEKTPSPDANDSAGDSNGPAKNTRTNSSSKNNTTSATTTTTTTSNNIINNTDDNEPHLRSLQANFFFDRRFPSMWSRLEPHGSSEEKAVYFFLNVPPSENSTGKNNNGRETSAGRW